MAEQGCVNEGTDKRLFGKVVCWLQQRLSLRSTYEPATLVIGFPPYLAINFPVPFSKLTKWGVRKSIHFRIGMRYDFNAKKYITPSAALKDVTRSLMYWGKEPGPRHSSAWMGN